MGPIEYAYEDLTELKVFLEIISNDLRALDVVMTGRAVYLISTGFGEKVGQFYLEHLHKTYAETYENADRLSTGLDKARDALQTADDSGATRFQ